MPVALTFLCQWRRSGVTFFHMKALLFHMDGWSRERQPTVESSPTSVTLLNGDAAAVSHQDLLDKSQTDPIAARLGREERDKYSVQVLFGDSRSGVANANVRVSL